MRIERLRIDGFGIFRDLTVEGFSPTLTVICGNNEAGKSTLLAFLRYVLFGFPDGRNRTENRFPPLNGGDHGGALVVLDHERRQYVIERHLGRRGAAARVILPSGQTGDQKDLERLLGSSTRELFRNVFAFSLSELQQFDTLSDDAIRSAIYSAGAGGAGVSLAQVERSLSQQMQALFKPRGSEAVVNKLLGDVEKARQAIQQAGGRPEEFDALQRELAAANAEVARCEAALEEASRQRDWCALLLQAWEEWSALCAAEQALAGLPQVDSFPVDGLPRLEGLLGQLKSQRDQLDEREAELRAMREEREAIVVDSSLLGLAPAVEELHRRRSQYSDCAAELPLLEDRAARAEAELALGLADLGPEWDRPKLEAFDTSLPERETVRAHREALKKAEEAGKERAADLARARHDLDRAQRAEREARLALEALPEPTIKDPVAAEVRARALRRVVALVRQREGLEARVADLEKGKAGLLDLRRSLAGLSRPGDVVPSFWPAVAVGLVAVMIGLALGYLAKVDPALAALLALAAGLVAGGAVLAVRSRLGPRGAAFAGAGHLRALEEQISKHEQEIGDGKARLRHLQDELERVCREVDVAVPESEAAADDVATVAASEVVAIQRWGELRQVWEKQRQALAEAEAVARKAAAASEEAARALAEARAAWATWLEGAGLRPGTTPEGALDLIVAVGQCRDKATALANLRGEADAKGKFLEDYAAQTAAVLSACGREGPEAADPGQAVDALFAALDRAREGKRRHDDLGKRIEEAAAQRDRAARGLAELERELDALLADGGAENEEVFRRRARTWEERQRLQREIAGRNATLQSLAGQGERLAALKDGLRTMAPDETRRALEKVSDRLERLQKELKEAHQRNGALQQKLQEVEAAGDLADLHLQEQQKLTRLRTEARKWAVYALARALVAQARERNERERQPEVIRDASGFFARITGGRYVRITTDQEQATLHVLDRDDRRRELAELSRGTQEQLYLAVRLGFIKEFSRRQAALPVIVDDALVNFDPERAEAALQTFLVLREINQVLLFTCHPETRDAARRVVPDAAFFTLDGGRLTPA